MKCRLLIIMFIFSFSISILAQEHHADTLKSGNTKDNPSSKFRSDSLLHKKKKVDSAFHRLGSKVNSVNDFQVSSLVKKRFQKDTVKTKTDTTRLQHGAETSKTDSVPKRQRHFDSLNYKKKKADAVAQRFNSKMDSLRHFQLSSLLRKRKLLDDSAKTKQDTVGMHGVPGRKVLNSDSVKERYTKSLTTVNSVPDSIQRKLNAPLKTAQKKIDSKTGFLDSLQLNVKNPVTDKSTNYSINGMETALPSKNVDVKDFSGSELKVPSATAPDLKLDQELDLVDNNPLDKVGDQMKNLKQQPQKQLENNDLLKDVSKIKDKTKEVGAATKKAEVYQEDIKNIKEGGLEKTKALPEDVEKAASNLSQVKEFKAETQKFEATKNVLQQYQDAMSKMNEEQLLAKAKDAGSKQLADHFTGNEEKLKTGVAQLDKLKKKYGNIPDSRYLPKRAPNPMNGKPLIERLIPGVNLQVFDQWNLVNVDLSPFLAYKISPRWRAGLGGTYRFQFNKKVQLVEDNPAYGYRGFTNILIWGGLHFHLEGELIKLIPYDFYSQSFNAEEGKKWIPGLHAGILKHYKISKKVNGNFQVLYNFLYQRNGLYPAKVNMRFGFEFPMKKKLKKSQQRSL